MQRIKKQGNQGVIGNTGKQGVTGLTGPVGPQGITSLILTLYGILQKVKIYTSIQSILNAFYQNLDHIS
jgi:hypothetical protein